MLPGDIAILEQVSAEQGSIWLGGQAADVSYQHAMRDGAHGQSIADALGLYTKVVAYNREQAYVLESVGTVYRHQLAFRYFGKGLLAIADYTSPAHYYFQPWDCNLIHITEHTAKESTIHPGQFTDAVQKCWRTTMRHSSRWT